MKTMRPTKKINGMTMGTDRDGRLTRGGLTLGDQHRVITTIRSGFDTVADIAKQIDLSSAKVTAFLKALQKDGDAFYDYAVNGWKLEGRYAA
jgi:hypothetical protein